MLDCLDYWLWGILTYCLLLRSSSQPHNGSSSSCHINFVLFCSHFSYHHKSIFPFYFVDKPVVTQFFFFFLILSVKLINHKNRNLKNIRNKGILVEVSDKLQTRSLVKRFDIESQCLSPSTISYRYWQLFPLLCLKSLRNNKWMKDFTLLMAWEETGRAWESLAAKTGLVWCSRISRTASLRFVSRSGKKRPSCNPQVLIVWWYIFPAILCAQRSQNLK